MATKKQQSISNFFSKPKTEVHQREQSVTEDFELPSSKRRKVSTEPDIANHATSIESDSGQDTNQLKPLSLNSQNSRSLPTRTAVTERTSRYLFSTSPLQDEENIDASLQDQARKEELHRRFVRKLGKPDSINDIKRRNKTLLEDDAGEDAEDDDDASPEPPKPQSRGRVSSKKSNKLTPMEKQIIDIKQAHMDTLLVVEVGYKFRFFGEDARTASKELGIVCIPGKFRFDEHPSEAHLDRFASASVPVHRLHVHVRRLVAAGHKVGVVRQLETAALKAVGDNRNAPFVRKLTNLYTKGTYIDDADGLDEDHVQASSQNSSTGFLLCMTEDNAKGYGNDDKVHVGIVAVQPATGDVIYDSFDDGFMRSEIETRLLHIAPCEFLIVGDLSKATEKLVQHLSGSKANVFGSKARVEKISKHKTFAAEAHEHVSAFYAKQLKACNTDSERPANIMDKILSLPEHVMVCLAALMKHMSEYGLDNVFDLTKYFQSFSARSHMLLNGNTLNSLEIYQNQTDHTVRGSLFWMLDRTKTRFGARLLRKWVGRPLLDRLAIEARLEAVEELNNPERAVVVEKLNVVLRRMKTDLEKNLLRIYYGKCTRPELLNVLQAFQFLAQEYSNATTNSSTGFSSDLLASAIMSLPTIQGEITGYLERINLSAAKQDDKYAFFREEHESEQISDEKLSIAAIEHDLDTFRTKAAETLGRKKPVDYVTVAGIDYLIEVDNSSNTIRKVPASWAKISGTKKVSRFHPPEVVKLIRERDQHKEALAAACDTAFQDLLVEVGSSYPQFRDAILALASLDCLVSLASVAAQPGYSRPRFVEGTRVEVVGARHPMIEQLLVDTYVPNDISLSSDATRALLVTGPNMGGKSSYVRSVALICIMAQIGCFVPAESATLGVIDAIFTRMGAFDNMMAGESTFMVELSETSDILKVATERSLVVLDELGRGTSTHDGVAIAGSVLDWLVREKKCLTLFITHYQVLARMADGFPAGELRNVHMRFSEDDEDGDHVTFLYDVGEGVAHRSYGLNVAHLAGLGTTIIDTAREKSSELEYTMRTKQLRGILASLRSSPNDLDIDSLADAIDML